MPVVIVLVTIVNLVASLVENNSAAMHANVVALLGWGVLAYDELFIKKEIPND